MLFRSTTIATFNHNRVEAIPPPRTAEVETDERPPATTPYSTPTQKQANHRHSIHTQPQPQSTAAAVAAAATPISPRGRKIPPPLRDPSAGLNSFEGSGSGDPSGDYQTEEEEELEEEVGSGIPPEASGAEEPVGKSLLFHFITHNALRGVFFFFNYFMKGWIKYLHITLMPSSVN